MSTKRRAHFYEKEKEMHYWKSDTLYGIATVKSLAEAEALLKGTNIAQRLLVYKSVFDKAENK